MKYTSLIGGLAFSALASGAFAQGDLPVDLVNRLRVEYDDNYAQLDDAKGSWKLADELEIIYSKSMDQSFFSIDLIPAIIWWENRLDEDFDFNFYGDMVFSHDFSPRVSMELRDRLVRSENPELQEGNVMYRQDNEYWSNNLVGSISTMVSPNTFVDVDGRYYLISYNDDNVSETSDYDKIYGALKLRHKLKPETELGAWLTYDETNYDSDVSARDANTIGLIGSWDQVFNPQLYTSLQLGYQNRDAKDTYGSDSSNPYGNLSLTYVPSPATRITVGGTYSVNETDIYPYSGQTYSVGFASISYDFTKRITGVLNASYSNGEYDAETLPEGATIGMLPVKQRDEIYAANPGATASDVLSSEAISSVSDADETTARFGMKLTYEINRLNSVDMGWRYTDSSSDLRNDYERNIVHVGWNLKL